MEPLHAPWRIDYILGPKPAPADADVFSRIAQSQDDEANYVIVRERSCYAVLNRYPYDGRPFAGRSLQEDAGPQRTDRGGVGRLDEIDAPLPKRPHARDETGRLQHRR